MLAIQQVEPPENVKGEVKLYNGSGLPFPDQVYIIKKKNTDILNNWKNNIVQFVLKLHSLMKILARFYWIFLL